MHWFDYKLTNPDRMTTKEQWKSTSRWLRMARNRVEEAIDLDEVCKSVSDALLYGIGVSRHSDPIYGKSPIEGE